VTTGATAPQRGRIAFAGLDFDRLARPALAVAVIASGLLLFHLTRGTSFWADDWSWIASRRGDTVNAFLAPYNGHLSLIPVAIYRLMFAVFGIGSYTPYRAVVIVLSLVVAVLVFTYARTRTGETVALLLATSMLFLGPGWQDTMWGFQIPWLLVCVAGIVALMLLERRTAPADAAACGLTLLAVCSTSLGLAFAIGIAVDLALTRRRWRDAWIVAIPLVLYVIWLLHYHPSAIDATAIPSIPLSIAKAAAASLSVLTGLSGVAPFEDTGASLTCGWPLVVIAAVLVLGRARTVRLPARAISLAATFAVFAASVSIAHGALATALTSRYIYVYCLLAALLAAELARGIRPSRLVLGSLCVLTLAAVISNVGSLRSAGAYLRNAGAATDGALTVLDLDHGGVTPNTPARVALYPFLKLSAGSYFDARRVLDTPAYTVAQLRHANSIAQSTADAQLLGDGDVTLATKPPAAEAAGASVQLGTTPSVLSSSNGAVARSGACVLFTPVGALAPGSVASATLRLGPGGLSVKAAAAAATVLFRRFSPTFTTLGTVSARGTAVVTIRRDAAPDSWYLQLSSIAPVRACTLRP
jgi:hypothetical protein